jgi:hypothetical protein
MSNLSKSVGFINLPICRALGVLNVVSYTLSHPNFKITSAEERFIENIIKESPEIFDNIDIALQEIIKDDKIDYHDVPQIVLMMSRILKDIKSTKTLDLISVIQIILDIILESGLLPITELEIDTFRRVIDSSLALLEINLSSPVTSTSIWDCCLHR